MCSTFFPNYRQRVFSPFIFRAEALIPEDGGSIFLRNVCTYLQVDKALLPAWGYLGLRIDKIAVMYWVISHRQPTRGGAHFDAIAEKNLPSLNVARYEMLLRVSSLDGVFGGRIINVIRVMQRRRDERKM
jgi:hypothetical protein